MSCLQTRSNQFGDPLDQIGKSRRIYFLFWRLQSEI